MMSNLEIFRNICGNELNIDVDLAKQRSRLIYGDNEYTADGLKGFSTDAAREIISSYFRVAPEEIIGCSNGERAAVESELQAVLLDMSKIFKPLFEILDEQIKEGLEEGRDSQAYLYFGKQLILLVNFLKPFVNEFKTNLVRANKFLKTVKDTAMRQMKSTMDSSKESLGIGYEAWEARFSERSQELITEIFGD